MDSGKHIVVLEPYYGGSHAAFVDTFAEHSRHRITKVTLPARKWKWRMRGAAIWFTREHTNWFAEPQERVDAILANDMLSVADLRALLPDRLRGVPIACYFHENQLTYPISPGQERDYQYGMTNITSCLAADVVWFNSRFHLEDFLSAAGALLRKMPDFVPEAVIEDIRAKADVLPPPVQEPKEPLGDDRQGGPLTFLWCHRWEYDKNPTPFFDALLNLDADGCEFNLVMLGEQFRDAPPAFAEAAARLNHRITHAGFAENRDDYWRLLAKCDVVVSTAIQENFGIGVIEAVLAGCQPLVPRRLAYPEVIPSEFHPWCLYDDDSDLHARLRGILDGEGLLDVDAKRKLRTAMAKKFSASTLTARLDEALASLMAC